MESVSCKFGGHTNYNNGWTWKYFNTSANIGNAGFGKDNYGHHRCIILKITTPDFTGYANKRFEINIPMCRSSSAGSGTDTFNYRITTTEPTFSESGAIQVTFPEDYICSGTFDVENTTSYKYQQIVTNAADFLPGTEYYIWLWSDTPYAASSTAYVGYYAHSTSVGGLITVNLLYENGVVMIDTGEAWVAAVPYIDNGTAWVQAVPYMDNGTDWVIAGS